jgi:DNA polymerase (family 10)
VIVGDVDAALRHLAGLRQVLRTDLERRIAYLTDGLLLHLHASEPAQLGNALVLNTGTAEHVAALAARAALRKLDVSVGSSAVGFESEAALYGALDLPLIPAELRNGRDELAQAEHSDFADLLALTDIAGMVHCHTTYSDGKHSIVEMARAAHALGMQYITITDHSPSAHYARGVTLDRLKAQWDEIEAARAEVPIRILRGTESDILADGSLDFPDDILERFDVIIASIHARHRLDRTAMTARLTRALSLPVFKIWGHALGRILNHRDPIDCDVPAILDALAGSRGAVEINADPHRLDLPPAWIPAARERGIPFVISVDAHSTRGLNVLRYGVTMARRGGIRKSEVLNAGSAEEFAERVRPV